MVEVNKKKKTQIFRFEWNNTDIQSDLKHSKVLRILLMMPSGKETGLSLGRIPQLISKGEQVTHSLPCLLTAGGWIYIYDDSKRC